MQDNLSVRRSLIRVRLPDGGTVHMQAVGLGGKENITSEVPEISDLWPTIEGIAQALSVVWKKVKPGKATVEFGIQVAVESGRLTALVIQGTAEANLKICLEWSDEPGKSPDSSSEGASA